MRPIENIDLTQADIPEVSTEGTVMIVREHPDNPNDIEILDKRIDFKPIINERDKQAIAIHSERYKLYPNKEFIEVVKSVTGEQFEGYISESWNRLDVYFYPKDLTIDVNPQVGDTIRLGLRFTNSYDGTTALRIQFIGMRLICMNGMTTKGLISQLSTRHTTKSLDSEKFGEIVSQLFDTDLTLLKNILQDAQHQIVSNPIEWVEALAWKNGLPNSIKVAVQEHLIRKEIDSLTRYDLWNIFTEKITHGWGKVEQPSRQYSESYLSQTHQKINDILTVSEDVIQKTISSIRELEEVQETYKDLIKVVAEP